MVDLVRGFFLAYGAAVTERNGVFDIVLTDDLVPWFQGARRLRYRVPLKGNEDEPGEVVAFGSRAFERIHTFLKDKGEYTELAFPARHQAPAVLNGRRALRGLRARLVPTRQEDSVDRCYIFNFQISYLSDERQEEIFTVAVDPDGRNRPDLLAVPADMVTVPTIRGEGGLAGRAGITRALREAKKYAEQHAAERRVEVEKEVMPRLSQAVSRLAAYYNGMIEEVPVGAGDRDEQIRLLRAELTQKTAEEERRHTVHTRVGFISHASLRLPVREYEYSLSNGAAKATVKARFELHDGVLRRPSCDCCREETSELALCHEGHVTCPKCSNVCVVCGREECRGSKRPGFENCGLGECAICGEEHHLCKRCQAICPACKHVVCPSHLTRCPVCGDAVCPACLLTCPECGRTECRSHGGKCEECARDVCSACLGTGACGHNVCKKHLAASSSDGQDYCGNCLTNCHDCGPDGSPVYREHATKCSVCQSDLCKTHAVQCVICWQTVCSDHAHTCRRCGRVACRHHTSASTGICTSCTWSGGR